MNEERLVRDSQSGRQALTFSLNIVKSILSERDKKWPRLGRSRERELGEQIRVWVLCWLTRPVGDMTLHGW